MRRARRTIRDWAPALLALSLWGLAAAGPRSAAAESVAPDVALGEALFREGRAHLEAGRLQEACRAFEESYVHDPATGTLHNLAVCHEQIGALSRAWAEYREVLERAQRTRDTEREAVARSQIEAIAPRIPRLSVWVNEATRELPGFSLLINRRALGAAALGAAIPLDLGAHTVVVRAHDHEEWTRTIEITEEGQVVRVEVPPLTRRGADTSAASVLASRTDGSANETPRPELDSEPASPLRTWGYVAAGVGLAGVGVGAVFGIVALGEKQDRDELCSARGCSEAGVTAHRNAERAAQRANLWAGVGGALLATGVVMILLAPDDDRASARLTLVAGPDGAGLAAFGHW